MPTVDELRRKVRFFARREELRAWLEANHATATDLWIGYYKKGSGRTSLSYEGVVEEALCFGWVDGQVRSLGEDSYTNRYTPRKVDSRWSQLNLRRVRALEAAGRMHPAGRTVFEQRSPTRAGHAFEERPTEFDLTRLREFRRSKEASRFFESQPPSYRRTATFGVMSARRAETRQKRLRTVIDSSRRKRRIDLLSPKAA